MPPRSLDQIFILDPRKPILMDQLQRTRLQTMMRTMLRTSSETTDKKSGFTIDGDYVDGGTMRQGDKHEKVGDDEGMDNGRYDGSGIKGLDGSL